MNKSEARYRLALARARQKNQKKIETFYNAYKESFLITLDSYRHKPKMGTHAILAKHELDGKYYFIIQDKHEKVYLAEVVHKSWVTLKKISQKSKEYELNKDIFDTWISHAKEGRKTEILNFFEKYEKKYMLIAVRKASDESGASLYKYISKHTHNGKYYFVMKSEDGYFVTKVSWFGFAMLVKLTENEFKKNRSVFESWLQEAKNSKKKK